MAVVTKSEKVFKGSGMSFKTSTVSPAGCKAISGVLLKCVGAWGAAAVLLQPRLHRCAPAKQLCTEPAPKAKVTCSTEFWEQLVCNSQQRRTGHATLCSGKCFLTAGCVLD